MGDGRRSEGRKLNRHFGGGRNAILAWRWWSIALTITTIVRGTKGKRIRRPACRTLTQLFALTIIVASLLCVQYLLLKWRSTSRNPASGNPRSVLGGQSSSIHFPFATALGRHGLFLKMPLLIHYSSLKATRVPPRRPLVCLLHPCLKSFLLPLRLETE